MLTSIFLQSIHRVEFICAIENRCGKVGCVRCFNSLSSCRMVLADGRNAVHYARICIDLLYITPTHELSEFSFLVEVQPTKKYFSACHGRSIAAPVSTS